MPVPASAPARPALPAVVFVRFRDRIESKGARFGLVYPWWIPVIATLGLIGGAGAGAAQRAGDAPVAVLVLAVVLVGGPCIAHFVIRPWLPWWVEVPFVLVGVGLLLGYPLEPGSVIDLAPVALAFSVAEATATDGLRRGLVATGAATAVLLLVGDFSTDRMTLHAGELVVGLMVGYMLRWQMRALAAEHAARAEERVRATLAERQRVAREIHDLVAHSLSVTLLHVTGARRALEQDADVSDAVDALVEAERIGRQAMADIRRTVGVLSTEQAEARPLPGAGDLETLVDDVRAAGLDVTWQRTGTLDDLSPAAGLALYRVTQESLANVAKHAPGAAASVDLHVDADAAELVVSNPLPHGARAGAGGSGLGGSGVGGMTSRAEQLGGRLDAGRVGDTWRVRLALPLDGVEARGHTCAVSRMLPS